MIKEIWRAICLRNRPEYFNIGVCRGMIVLRETVSTVRPSVDLRGLSSSSHRLSGGPTRLFGAADGTNVRPFPTCVSQAGRRGPEPGAWQAPHTPRQDFARCQRRPRRISQLLPPLPGPAASRWGERVHRVLRTKTSDRGAWKPCQDGVTLWELAK